MDREGMTKTGVIWTLSITLGIVSLGLLAGLIAFILISHTYSVQLENVYKRSLYELSTNINDIEVDISKLVATNSSSSQQEILTSLYQNCVLAENNLSCLPISNNNSDKLNSFINKMGGYTYSLLLKVNAGDTISDTEFETITSLHNQSEIMVYEINTFLSRQDYDFSVLKQVDFSNYDNDYLSNISESMGSSTEVPSLIYDGPFSESVTNREIKGLEERFITVDDGLSIIATLLPEYSEVQYVGDAFGKFVVFNYSAKYEGTDYFIQITQMGGFILSISANSSNDGENYSTEQCETIAESFAKQLGVNNMYSVWSATSNGIAYVNLAPIISKTIYYPDLIKVKVDVSSGKVIGWEATNYCYNHVDREEISAKISILDAEQLVSSRLTVVERNYCVIPNEFVGESFAYEFVCEWDKYIYYVYLSVEDGSELNIMRVVKTSFGDLMV